MKINQASLEPIYETPTRTVNKTQPCNYLKALFNTLVHFKPKKCIEIGTYNGNTTRVFQRYFDQYMPDGLLVTCDIKKYVDFSHLKNVKQIIVAHHIPNIDSIHRVTKDELLFSDHNNSVQTNINLLKQISPSYDFAFIDGDHTKASFLKDIEICESVLTAPQTMLIDDTKDTFHECSTVYYEMFKNNKNYECYDFQDWYQFAGCSLVRRTNESFIKL